jgi:hypothetical protein
VTEFLVAKCQLTKHERDLFFADSHRLLSNGTGLFKNLSTIKYRPARLKNPGHVKNE